MPANAVPAIQSGARSTSDLLLDFAEHFSGERVPLRDLVAALDGRSFGFLLLLFALPNSLPIVGIPGLSTVTGLPLAIVALQMLLGYSRPRLPRWVADRSLPRAGFQRLIHRTAPWLARVERLLSPRLLFLTGEKGERALGGICLLLAIVLSMPIPFGNLMPGLAVTLVALGIIARDGVLVILGLLVGAAGVAMVSTVIWATVEAAFFFVTEMVV